MSTPVSAQMKGKMPEAPKLERDPGTTSPRRFVVDPLLPLRILHPKAQRVQPLKSTQLAFQTRSPLPLSLLADGEKINFLSACSTRQIRIPNRGTSGEEWNASSLRESPAPARVSL